MLACVDGVYPTELLMSLTVKMVGYRKISLSEKGTEHDALAVVKITVFPIST